MILATEGTSSYPFNRLMTWTSALIDRGFIQEEVVLLSGSSTEVPPAIERYEFRTESCLTELSSQASLIISDCDATQAGTPAPRLQLLDRIAKPYILVPRTSSYNELMDDRQIELGAKLASFGIPVAWCPGDLVRFLSSPRRISLPLSQDIGDGIF